ncbi:unnamed protein product [Trichobilharzia regenti]|nr:unnamed protein product [Trichobilharzia regenti]
MDDTCPNLRRDISSLKIADSVREDLCGFIEILPKQEPVEIRPSPAIPPNITMPEVTDDKERETRIIAGGIYCVFLFFFY